jgi:hypothetical protein
VKQVGAVAVDGERIKMKIISVDAVVKVFILNLDGSLKKQCLKVGVQKQQNWII